MTILNSLIEKDEPENILLVDGHNLIFRTIFIADQQNTKFGVDDDKTFSYWKYLFINSIFKMISNFEPTKVIIAIDSRKNWRKDVYSEYKAHRKAARDNSGIDFEAFFPVFDAFYEDLKTTLCNMMWIRVDRCEGDDIIAVATRMYKNSKIKIISTDRDLNQLMKNKNVVQYDPIKRKYVESVNPAVDLELKIIMGDKGDNIPAIRPKVGPATAASIISKGTLQELLESDINIQKNYIRNTVLIDLEKIPSDVENAIIEEINSYTLKKLDGKKFFNFAIKHRLASLLDTLQETKILLGTLDDWIEQ